MWNLSLNIRKILKKFYQNSLIKVEQLDSIDASEPSAKFIEDATFRFVKGMLEHCSRLQSLELTTKISRLILELAKFRVQNCMKVVSLETLPLLHQEILSQELFKWSLKQGFFLPRDQSSAPRGYIFSDFEKESADICLLAISSLRSLAKFLNHKNTDILDLLKRLKSVEVKN